MSKSPAGCGSFSMTLVIHCLTSLDATRKLLARAYLSVPLYLDDDKVCPDGWAVLLQSYNDYVHGLYVSDDGKR
jgi:hypothetical protein